MSRTPQRPQPPRPQVIGHNVPDIDAAQRLTQQLADFAQRQTVHLRATTTANLIVGDNRINHDLGVKPNGANVTPTVADATFAWALKLADDKQVVITVVGVNQPGARVEVWS